MFSTVGFITWFIFIFIIFFWFSGQQKKAGEILFFEKKTQ